MGTTQLETVPEPKYWHLKTVLSEALDSDFAVGEILPNERDLAARFGVARATLRQALEQLELEGRLQRRRGVGTTVAPPRVGVAVGSDAARVAGRGRRRLAARGLHAGGPARGGGRHPGDRARRAGAHGAPLPGDARPARRRRTALHPGVLGARPLRASTRPRARHARVPCCASCSAWTWTARTAPWSSARPARTTPRSSTGCPARPSSSSRPASSPRARTAAVSVATYRADTCRLTFGDSGGVEIHHDPERRAS